MNIPEFNVMLDLETMGTNTDSAIVSIGAVLFSSNEVSKRPLDKFYRKVSLVSCVRAGLKADPETIEWWMQQNDDARKELYTGNRKQICDALWNFKIWFEGLTKTPKDIAIWANSPSFDCKILSYAYNHLEIPQPWNFRNEYCYRTINNLFPQIKRKPIGIKHNALDDAKSQAEHLLEIFDNENNKKKVN